MSRNLDFGTPSLFAALASYILPALLVVAGCIDAFYIRPDHYDALGPLLFALGVFAILGFIVTIALFQICAIVLLKIGLLSKRNTLVVLLVVVVLSFLYIFFDEKKPLENGNLLNSVVVSGIIFLSGCIGIRVWWKCLFRHNKALNPAHDFVGD